MKLEVGMYVRTKKGNIYKFETNNSMAKNGAKKYMVNCSYNIIDLIEVGDYVNSEKIDYISISKDGKKRPLIRDNIYLFDKYKSINSIVTKEQMEQMAYKVGE